MNIILASKSPRRKSILSKLNFPFKVIHSNFNEDEYNTKEKPSSYVVRLANGKASNIALSKPEDLVIGADTAVLLNNKILGKPKNHAEAKKQLLQLSGKTHTVITGVCIQQNFKNINYSFYSKTDVTFYTLDEYDINLYIKSNGPMDKAGSYGIQDYSSIFVKKINGCYFNVVGFPLAQFYLEINKLGVNLREFK
tara:strand:- start:443 stop:1027 length:585 start_codon:yes stop_codon:yes gene_type:complete